jgi:tetratricopeptide (TPR) repeat protein
MLVVTMTPATPPAGEDSLARLRDRLRRLHLHSGSPSLREIQKRTSRGISHTTARAILRCEKLPGWGQLELLVEALGGEVEEFRRLWLAARDPDSVSEPSSPDPLAVAHTTDVAFLIPGLTGIRGFLASIGVEVWPIPDAATGQTIYTFDIDGAAGPRSCVALLVDDADRRSTRIQVAQILAAQRPKVVVVLGIARASGSQVRAGDVVIASPSDGGAVAARLRPLNWARNFQPTHPDRYRTWQLNAAARLSPTEPADREPVLHVGPVTLAGPDSGQPPLAALAAAVTAGNLASAVAEAHGEADFLAAWAISTGDAAPADLASATLLVRTLLEASLLTPDEHPRRPSTGSPMEPPARNRFVGRTDVLAELERLLTDSEVQLVTITGEGGIGKTRLTREFLRASGSLFPAGAHFADLGSNFQLRSVEEAIARAVGADGLPVNRAGLIAVLRLRRGLLVLDNFESVAARAPLIQQIVQDCPDLKVLLTSRVRLGVPGEHVLRLDPLSHPRDASLSEAVALFVTRVKEHTGRSDWSAAELAMIAEICQLLEGVPLAVELAASQAGHLGIADLLRQVAGSQQLSGDPVPAIRAGLDRSFASSLDRLTEEQLLLLQAVAYFEGSASLDALNCLAGVLGGHLTDNLGVLIDRSLLRMAFDPSGSTRFSLLAPLREHVRRRPWPAGSHAAVEGRHARYFVDLAWTARNHLFDPAQAIWLDKVEADVWNFSIAHDVVTRDGSADDAMRIQGGLTRFWLVRDFLTLGETLANNTPAPDSVEAQNDVWAEFSLSAGLITWLRGQHAPADAMFARVVDFGARSGLVFYESNALANRGLVAADLGDLAEARRYYLEGEQRARGAGDDWNCAICVSGRAGIEQREGLLDVAAATYLEGIDLFRRTGDTWSLARILRRLLSLAVELHDDEMISTTAEEARAMGDVVKDAHSDAELDFLLAQWDEHRNRMREALRGYFSGAARYARLGRTSMARGVLRRAHALLLRQGEYELAGRVAGSARQLVADAAEFGESGESGSGAEASVTSRLSYARGFNTGFRENVLVGLGQLRDICDAHV